MEFLDTNLLIDQGMALSMGLALAATCGLRAFLPLLTISVLAALGQLELGAGFMWMASPAAIVCFSTAVVVEVVSDKFPAVDHALDAAGVFIKPVAAAVVTASMVVGFDPLLALVLGLMSGGVVAEGVHLAKAKARLLSSAFTGTIANPILSVGEDIAAVIGIALSLLVPALGLVIMVGLSLLIAFRWRRRQQLRAA
ncbi:MAG: hypothetical protein ACI8S6_001135 [Myxococcota bacterium]|jgi:hypothetical protein